MSTLTEVRTAAAQLPLRQQQSLIRFLSRRLGRGAAPRAGLKAARRPPLEGLPRDLSKNTGAKVRSLVAQRHAAHR